MRSGITQGALLIIDRSLMPCDCSVVMCCLVGEFHLQRFRLHPYRQFERLEHGRTERIDPKTADDNDGIFGVVTPVSTAGSDHQI